MLTTDDFPTYNFKSSPDTSTEDSFLTDIDIHSDEDFLQSLSSDLDIPLLLNSNSDDLGLLNTCFDKSPDEILSEITPPGSGVAPYDFNTEFDDLQHLDFTQWDPDTFPNLQGDIKQEDSSSTSSQEFLCSNNVKSESPTPSLSSSTPKGFDIKEELMIDTPPVSPNNEKILYDVHMINENIPKLNIKNIKIIPHESKNKKVILKKVNIPLYSNKNKTSPVMLADEIPTKQAKFIDPTANSIIRNYNNASPKVVILENIKAVPITTIPQFTTIPTTTSITTMNTSNGYISMPIVFNDTKISTASNIDPKILKRQQRMIKNRESANLSRKKKKEYLSSLEKKIEDLTEENDRLKMENTKLKDTLIRHGFNISSLLKGAPTQTVTKTLVLCVVLFTIGFNMNFIRDPLHSSGSLMRKPRDNLPQLSDHHGRSLLWSAGMEDTMNSDNTTSNTNKNLPMCPMYVNQSENVRIAQELHRWIGKPYNVSEEFHRRDLSREKYKTKKLRSRKSKFDTVDTPILSSVYRLGRKSRKLQSTSNELQVFTPNVDHVYTDFFEAINRRDDTFYVVSFSADHMLLPALHYNKTMRPKMSLLMPSVISNDTSPDRLNLVPLMQIDCEVLNTRLIHVKHGAIPQHFRANNQTQSSYEHPQDIREEPEQNYSDKYMPYFMRNIKNKARQKPMYLENVKDDFEENGTR